MIKLVKQLLRILVKKTKFHLKVTEN